MRVAFLTEFYPTKLTANVRGGVEQRTFILAQALSQRGHQVTVVACREPETPVESHLAKVRIVRPGPTATYKQSGGLLGRLRYAIAARRVMLDEQVDCICVENFLGYAIALTLPGRLRRRSVLTYHDVWIGEWVRHVGFLTGILGECIERIVVRQQWLHWIVNSETTKQKLVAHGVRPEVIDVLYSGVYISDIERIVAEKFDRPTITAVARLVAYKRIDDLIHATDILRKELPLIQTIIAGSGPERQHLDQLIQKLHLQDHVELRGFVERHEDVLAMIKGSTVFCFPSAVEGMGLVSVEAMACGVPYVSTDIPPTREVTGNGQGGILYPVGDVAALAKGLRQIILETEERPRRISAARSRVFIFDWPKLVDRFTSLLSSYVKE